MQKLRIVDVEAVNDSVIALPAAQERSRPRLADASDIGVQGPARRLQNDLAHAFTADAKWSVKRTVIAGLVFHGVILGALAVAAGSLVQHLAR